jgi:hypothetical protein
MSKNQMEKNLDYGDCNNVFCFFVNVLESVGERVEKTIDSIVKKD